MNNSRVADDRPLRHVLWELRPYLDELVIIGGWVPYLYRHYGELSKWRTDPPFTREIDLLVPPSVPRQGREPIPKILRVAGFRPVGQERPAFVWAKEPAAGEKVEFLTAHTGPAKQISQVASVQDQGEMGAVSLDGLDLLRSHTRSLSIPLGTVKGELQYAVVRVPLLGAYVINKAITFPRRRRLGDESDNQKQAKDLLYLRDIAAAGPEVTAQVREDCKRVGSSAESGRPPLQGARNTLDLTLKNSWAEAQREAAHMLRERVGGSEDAALADIRGHLTDLKEIIEEVLSACESPNSSG